MEQRNVIVAIVLSVAILLGFQFYLTETRPPRPPQPAQTAEQAGDVSTAPDAASAPTGATQPAVPAGEARQAALEDSPRVAIETPTLEGSISLIGGRVDDLILKNYRETVEPESERIVLLSPEGTPKAYYAEFGWAGAAEDVDVPRSDTRWQASGGPLTPGNPVTLSWTNEGGLTFERIYAIDENYLFTVTQRIVNESGDAIDLAPYGLVKRRGTPDVLGFYILHEGLIGVLDGTLREIDYDDLQDEGRIQEATTGGWLGITDKYWLVALLPQQTEPVTTRFVHTAPQGIDRYQTDYLYPTRSIPAGGSVEVTSRLFAGAKKVLLLDRYEEEYGIQKFDLAVDFGWFYFLTKPFFLALHTFAQWFGNFGLGILLLTVLIKLVFFPLANKSYKSMARMRKLQPKMIELRERYGDDKQRLNQEMMELYKREKVNPVSGCLPIVIQIPVFFALYKVLFVTIEMRHAPFFGWIRDLSAPDPTSILNLFGLLPWAVPELGAMDILNIGILPIIMGITMFAQQKLNPQPADPTQARIFMMLPIVFTFILARFPAGLVIYWTWNNLLTILQQYVIMRRQGVPIGGKMPAFNLPGMKPAGETKDEGASAGEKAKDESADKKSEGEKSAGEKDSGQKASAKSAGKGKGEAAGAGASSGKPAAAQAKRKQSGGKSRSGGKGRSGGSSRSRSRKRK